MSRAVNIQARRGRDHAAAGFTLLEVMIALAILFGALVSLTKVVTANVRATARAKQLSVAIGLTQGKMLDMEEKLLHDGFGDQGQSLDGDFSDQGYPKVTWHAEIERVEIPGLQQMQQAKSGADSKDKGGDSSSSGLGSGLAAFMPGGGAPGGAPGDKTAAMGAQSIMGQFDLIKGVLEQAIRKVTITVKWKVDREQEQMTVVCYFTDPKAVDAAMGGLMGGPPPSAGGAGGAGGSGGPGGSPPPAVKK